MNTTLTIRLPLDLKEDFLKKSKENWVDGSLLLRHFISRYNQNPKIAGLNIDEDEFDYILDETLVKIFDDKKIKWKLSEIWKELKKIKQKK